MCSQPIDFARQLCFQFSPLSLQSINITCKSTGFRGSRDRNNMQWTSIHCIRQWIPETFKKAQGKDQKQNGNADLIFMMLRERDSEKDWGILMKDLIGIRNYWLCTFEKLYSSLTKLHFLKKTLYFPYCVWYNTYSKWQRLQDQDKIHNHILFFFPFLIPVSNWNFLIPVSNYNV